MSEHDELLFFINRLRDGVVRIVDGVDEERLRSPGVASGTNLLGLVWHLRAMELKWMQEVFAGRVVDVDPSHDAPSSMGAAEVVAGYREACAESDRVVRGCPDLSTLSAGTARLPASTAWDAPTSEPRRVSLREVVVHLIEETARHAGHADILREQLDGATDR